MENKIQELTDKLYREGVEKGNEQAQAIVAKAQEEAQRILADAQAKAKAIQDEASKQAQELRENTQSELKLFAGQTVSALKTEIANLLTQQTVGEAVKGFTTNENAVNDFIIALANNWSASEGIIISTEKAEELKKIFLTRAKDLLDKGVKIEQVNGVKTLFTITPADGSYKINFGEEEFQQYFQAFLRPQLVASLF